MSLPPEYFDKLYEESADPWGFATRRYEQRKYTLTLAALPNADYRRGFEPGCSIGVLTSLLARRCDQLIASDPSETAITLAQTSTPANVEFHRASVPDQWPDGTFDLIVCSEVGYYLSTDDLNRFINKSLCSLEPAGQLVAVHWRPQVKDYPQDGAAVHRQLAAAFHRTAHYEDEFILLDVFGSEHSSLVAPE